MVLAQCIYKIFLNALDSRVRLARDMAPLIVRAVFVYSHVPLFVLILRYQLVNRSFVFFH